jgi:hypothetical protein
LKTTFYILFTIILLGCKQKENYPYQTSDFRPELKYHLEKLASENELPSKDTISRNYLMNSCSKEELMNLMNINIPLLRVISYSTIVKRKEANSFQILLNHLDDTSKVNCNFECIHTNENVSDIMISKVDRQNLSRDEKDTLIDRVLRNHIYLDIAQEMMSEIEPKSEYYSIIKSQTQSQNNEWKRIKATLGLARYRKREDVPLILKNLNLFIETDLNKNYVFKIIEIFNEPEFWPVIVEYFNNVFINDEPIGSRDLIIFSKAVAKYRNQKSLQILKQIAYSDIFNSSYQLHFNKQYVFKAIHKYPSKLYDSLYVELAEQLSGKNDVKFIKNIERPDHEEGRFW